MLSACGGGDVTRPDTSRATSSASAASAAQVTFRSTDGRAGNGWGWNRARGVPRSAPPVLACPSPRSRERRSPRPEWLPAAHALLWPWEGQAVGMARRSSCPWEAGDQVAKLGLSPPSCLLAGPGCPGPGDTAAGEAALSSGSWGLCHLGSCARAARTGGLGSGTRGRARVGQSSDGRVPLRWSRVLPRPPFPASE